MTMPPEPPLSPEELRELRHDLRTPFNAIIGFTEMLMEVAEDEGHDAFLPLLQQVKSDARDLLGVVNTALAPNAEVRSDDLRRLGDEVYARLDPLAGQLQVLFDQARQGGVESFLPDLGRIRDAIFNLMRLVVDRLRGDYCILPPTGSAAQPAAPLTLPSWAGSAPRCWGNVLVVDDIHLNRALLCRRLIREGYRAQRAKSGREALEMLESGHFDLVLLDVLMPDLDGYEVLRRMKAHPTLRDIPVIMISALDEMRSVVRCIEMGAEDYLPKPFDPILLRARVGACLEKKRLRDKELEYLDGVKALQAAASAVESGVFQAEALACVVARTDELGTLARVFQRMASEVKAREERLKTQLTQLQIEIDEARKTKHVEEVTSGGFFQNLRGRAEKLRARMGKKA
jgi:DNA-binding response OmpR family regulator